MEPCNQRRVAGPCGSQKYQMTQSQYSVNALVGEVGATGLIVIPAPFPEGWACCCSPGCNRIGLVKQRLGTPGAVRVGGIENEHCSPEGRKETSVFWVFCVLFFFFDDKYKENINFCGSVIQQAFIHAANSGRAVLGAEPLGGGRVSPSQAFQPGGDADRESRCLPTVLRTPGGRFHCQGRVVPWI